MAQLTVWRSSMASRVSSCVSLQLYLVKCGKRVMFLFRLLFKWALLFDSAIAQGKTPGKLELKPNIERGTPAKHSAIRCISGFFLNRWGRRCQACQSTRHGTNLNTTEEVTTAYAVLTEGPSTVSNVTVFPFLLPHTRRHNPEESYKKVNTN